MSPASRMLVFGLVVLVVLGGLHTYLYLRLVRDTTSNRRLRLAGKVVVVLLALAMVSARFVYARLPHSAAMAFTATAWVWMGLATYLVLTFVSVGLARRGFSLAARAVRFFRRRGGAALPEAPPDVARRQFVSRVVAGSALAISSGFVGYGAFRAFKRPRLVDLALKLPGLPKALDGFRLVQLSDIHVGGVIETRFVREIVERTNALKPDLVAVTGDLVDGPVEQLGPAVAEFRRFSSRYGTFFCTGNHEYYAGVDEWVAALPGFGMTVLRNRTVRIGDEGASFDLVGVDDWHMRGREGGYDLEAATRGRPLDRAAVLLAHQPQDFDAAVKKGIGLQLSGHTHGGQFFPGTTVVNLAWRYPAGLFSLEDSHIYVSRGTGFWGPPLRVGSPPEIVRVTFLA